MDRKVGMNSEERNLYNLLPVGKILIEGSIKKDTDTDYSVPFCIAKGPLSYIGYIVLLRDIHSQSTAFNDILDEIFPENVIMASNGISTSLERLYYIGHRVVGFDSGIINEPLGFGTDSIPLFNEESSSWSNLPSVQSGECFNTFCKRVVRNAIKAYDIGLKNYRRKEHQLSLPYNNYYYENEYGTTWKT